MYFKSLNYTLGDEDSSVEHAMLQERNEHVVSIAGCGGRVIPLLARQPGKLICVDISPIQLELTRFRLAAAANLELDDYLGLLGYTPMEIRKRERLFNLLNIPKNSEYDRLKQIISRDYPLIYQGRFEKMLHQLYTVIRFVIGNYRHTLFSYNTLEEQREFITTKFPRKRWNLLVIALGNSAILNSLLYRGEFPKKNIAGSHASIYHSIFETLFNTILARRSFFLQMIFLGEIKYADGYPIECQAEIYHSAQLASKQCEIDYYCGDVLNYLSNSSDVNFVSLSDVPSFLSNQQAISYLKKIQPGLAPGALVVSRGHMRVIEPELTGFYDSTEQIEDIIKNESTQLWRISSFTKL